MHSPKGALLGGEQQGQGPAAEAVAGLYSTPSYSEEELAALYAEWSSK